METLFNTIIVSIGLALSVLWLPGAYLIYKIQTWLKKDR